MFEQDTIAVISTPPGQGSIGIVRMSGYDSQDIIRKMFFTISNKKLGEIEDRHFYYGNIKDKKQDIIDEVLMVCMKGPRSYTKEDIVEIHCHGSIISTRRILELSIEYGARLAEPGEFTKRAFLNGRLDLAQAEAVMDLICAKSDEAAKASLIQMEGALSKKIKGIQDKLLNMLAHIEVTIDYPEEDVDDLILDEIRDHIGALIPKIQHLIDTAGGGKLIRQGIKTVIIGKPNVGKSSLLNAMARDNRAIVTEIPGTTRDIIEEYITVKGIQVNIIDTAGIRETDDIIERMGVERSKKSIEDADLIILMFDASRPLEKEDEDIIKRVGTKNTLVVINKIDLDKKLDIDGIEKVIRHGKIVETSLVDGEGIDKIEQYIYDMVFSGDVAPKDQPMVTNIRHEQSLKKAKEHLDDAMGAIDNGVPLDLISIDIKSAWEALGLITGQTVTESLIDEIFSNFCLGK